MESKLKQLKVAQLKEILTKAGATFKDKEVKGDLISKVLASPAALKIANGGEENKSSSVQDEDLLAPPEEFDWDGSSSAVPATAPAPAAAPKPPAAPVETKAAPLPTTQKPTSVTSALQTAVSKDESTTDPTVPATTVDEELERRKRRAARFGVPLQEPKPAKENKERRQNQKQKEKQSTVATEDAGKLKAREERFGVQQEATAGQKRAAELDPEELARRQKRAERFGTTVKAT